MADEHALPAEDRLPTVPALPREEVEQEPAPESALEGLAWVAAAAGSGVLGNAAYDAAKAVLVKIVQRVKNPADRYSQDHVQVAKLAVQTRCRDLGWPVPQRADMRVARIDDDGVICLRYGRSSAHVSIVNGGDEIYVHLHAVDGTANAPLRRQREL